MDVAFKIFTSGMATIAAWFIWDLIREFKSFKNETKDQMHSLKFQREELKMIVGDAKQVIIDRVSSLEQLHNKYNFEVNTSIRKISNEMDKLQNVFELANTKVANFDKFFGKMLVIIKTINDRAKKTELELNTIKIELGEITIIKQGQKKPASE